MSINYQLATATNQVYVAGGTIYCTTLLGSIKCMRYGLLIPGVCHAASMCKHGRTDRGHVGADLHVSADPTPIYYLPYGSSLTSRLPIADPAALAMASESAVWTSGISCSPMAQCTTPGVVR